MYLHLTTQGNMFSSNRSGFVISIRMGWFKHILFMTQHDKALGRAKIAMFSPLQNTHTHMHI